jgi:glycosyltransferase involved in cell wall biosynthesis
MALNQKHESFRVIFVDDCSTDKSVTEAKKFINKHNNLKLIVNSERKGALENQYNAICSCSDDEIIVTLDGDDWLAHEHVLERLDTEYIPDVWMTWGSYKNHPGGGRGIGKRFEQKIIDNNSYRTAGWRSSHLRSFRTWLFKQIAKEDLMHKGKFYSAAGDLAFMIPMLEMSGSKGHFISDVLYIYNNNNPLQDHKVHRKEQLKFARAIRQKKPYPRLTAKPSP